MHKVEIWEELVEDEPTKSGVIAGVCVMIGLLLVIIVGFIIALK